MADYRFKYTGTENHHTCSIHHGILTNLHLEEEAEHAPHYLHIFPHHDFDAYSKEDLWEQIKSFCEGSVVEVGDRLIQC